MRTLYLIFAFLLSYNSFGQKRYTLVYQSDNYKNFIKHPQTQFKDSAQAINYIVDLSNTAISKGYILASVDSINYVSSQRAEVYIHIGDKFESSKISISKTELDFIKKHERINEKLISEMSLTPKELSNSLRKILDSYLNNGYPFASIQFVDSEINDHSLQASLKIERGPFVRWQKLHVKGDSSISVKYVSSLLNIKNGDLYDESLLKTISSKIEQVAFLEEVKSHEILYTKEGSELYVYLRSTPISSFNGIVGLQPDPNTEKLSVTGELNLRLLNTLKRGELLDVRWQSIRDQTQSLKSHLNYPFLFKTSFGVDATFDLYKRDTSFLELNSSVGVQYFLNQGNYLKAYYQNLSSSVLSGGKNNPSFNRLGNTKSHNYGLAYISNRVDYLPNPRKGFKLKLKTSAGTRNSQLNDTSLVNKSITFRGEFDLEVFIPLYKRHVLRVSNVTEYYTADEIFDNEVYRFGGLNEQRGFNEDELLATTRNTSVLEYRFLLDKNSHVFAFGDLTWYENNSSSYYNDTPLGFGLGFSFRTNLGVFSISYALGKQLNNPILLSNSKVHFGYIAYF